MIHVSMDDYNKAIEIFQIALEIDPGFSQARFMLGVCYHEIMSIDDAYKQYNILKKEDKKLADELIQIITT
jgi:tetratricopeptide (TPR) repeat protein